jgi:hypothetical protein
VHALSRDNPDQKVIMSILILSILTEQYFDMCIQIRVTYPCCLHVHLGYEVCTRVDPDSGHCAEFERRPRIDPFCPLCSKTEYRAHKVLISHKCIQIAVTMLICSHQLQADKEINTQQSLFSGQVQPQSERDYVAGKQKAVNDAEKPIFDRLDSDSPVLETLVRH